MNQELKAYLRLEAKISAAFNFFINGMIAALIYHRATMVATDLLSLAIDITLTCLLIFTLTAFFCRASVRRSKTAGILESTRPLIRRLRLWFRHPYLFSILLGSIVAAVLFIVAASIFALCGLAAIPFGVYIAVKCVSCAILGSLVNVAGLYLGMIRVP